MKHLPIASGYEVIVDDEDFHYLSRFHWGITNGNGTVTAVREFTIGKRLASIPMWKFIIPGQNNMEVLFLNRNSLDMRKENLRIVPIYVANHRAMKKSRGRFGMPTSKYKGVSYSASYKGHKKWIADIVLGEKRFTKHFFHEWEAAEYYNEKALEIYGEHAFLNTIDDRPTSQTSA